MAIRDELTKRKKVIWLIIILLLILIIGAIVYLLLIYFKVPILNNNTSPNLNQVPVQPGAAQPIFNTPNTGVTAEIQELNNTVPVNTDQQNVIFIASSFAERFGTYSNQGNYKNFDELGSLITASMQTWLTQYKAQLEKENPDISSYYALETKAISTQVRSLNSTTGQGEILVKTQRQEFKNSTSNPRVFYQDILLKLVNVNNVWKVNGAYWQ
ncbi:MAG: hypothetical protein WC460_03895 [Patescibacteria group bacterium]